MPNIPIVEELYAKQIKRLEECRGTVVEAREGDGSYVFICDDGRWWVVDVEIDYSEDSSYANIAADPPDAHELMTLGLITRAQYDEQMAPSVELALRRREQQERETYDRLRKKFEAPSD
jgi:hypothetical protein